MQITPRKLKTFQMDLQIPYAKMCLAGSFLIGAARQDLSCACLRLQAWGC